MKIKIVLFIVVLRIVSSHTRLLLHLHHLLLLHLMHHWVGCGHDGRHHLGLRGRRRHKDRRRKNGGQFEALQLVSDQLAGYGKLVHVHLAIAVNVGQTPERERE